MVSHGQDWDARTTASEGADAGGSGVCAGRVFTTNGALAYNTQDYACLTLLSCKINGGCVFDDEVFALLDNCISTDFEVILESLLLSILLTSNPFLFAANDADHPSLTSSPFLFAANDADHPLHWELTERQAF